MHGGHKTKIIHVFQFQGCLLGFLRYQLQRRWTAIVIAISLQRWVAYVFQTAINCRSVKAFKDQTTKKTNPFHDVQTPKSTNKVHNTKYYLCHKAITYPHTLKNGRSIIKEVVCPSELLKTLQWHAKKSTIKCLVLAAKAIDPTGFYLAFSLNLCDDFVDFSTDTLVGLLLGVMNTIRACDGDLGFFGAPLCTEPAGYWGGINVDGIFSQSINWPYRGDSGIKSIPVASMIGQMSPIPMTRRHDAAPGKSRAPIDIQSGIREL